MTEAVGGLAVMFPGQGSQAVGMGADLYAAEPRVREALDAASEVLGYDAARRCADGPREVLDRTDVAQPLLLAVSVGIWRALADRGLRPGVVLGHSLGEYTALVASGVLSYDDALRVVRARGEAMARAAAAEPGGMAAVLGLDDATVEALCADVEGVWPANYNSPGQVVVSGRRAALETLTVRAREAGARKVVPLAVSGAFHSPLMEPALPALREALSAAAWGRPALTFFSVCSLREESDGFVDLLLRQLVSPVRFAPAVSLLQAAGYDAFLEVGPGAVLSGLVRRIAPAARVTRVGDLETLAAFAAGDGRMEEA